MFAGSNSKLADSQNARENSNPGLFETQQILKRSSKVFIVQRSKGSLLGDQYGGNRRSLSESSSLTGDITEEAGQRGSMQVKVIEPNNRRYKDICFGSPYRKVPLETRYINCKLTDAFFISISFLDVHLL